MHYIELKIDSQHIAKLFKHGQISIDHIQCESPRAKATIQAIALGLSTTPTGANLMK